MTKRTRIRIIKRVIKYMEFVDKQIEHWATLFEEKYGNGSVNSRPEPFVVHSTDNKEEIRPYRDEIFSLISNSYVNKGGFLGADNPRTLPKDIDSIKFVVDENGNIIARALYRTDLGGFKRFGSASLKNNPMSERAVLDIIKSVIEPYDGWYWVEASDGIEERFKELNGNPIPNSLAKYMLDIDDGDFFKLDDDGVHYTRKIRGIEKRKMLFGFKDEESKQLAEDSVADYLEFKLNVNGSAKRIEEAEDSLLQSVIEARRFISRFFDFHYEEGINEMLPSWRDMIIESIEKIKDNISIIPEKDKKMFESAVKRGEPCLDDMQILKFHKLDFGKLKI